jgi:sulfur carrier protein
MSSPAITVTVNGERQTLTEQSTLADVVASTSPGAGRGVAVAVNDHVVPRRSWHATTLRADDRVEVLTAVQGG